MATRAEGVLVPAGTLVGAAVYPDTRFLIERSDLDHYNLVEKRLEQTQAALAALEARPCPPPPVKPSGVLERIGWPGIALVGALTFVGGVYVGARAIR